MTSDERVLQLKEDLEVAQATIREILDKSDLGPEFKILQMEHARVHEDRENLRIALAGMLGGFDPRVNLGKVTAPLVLPNTFQLQRIELARKTLEESIQGDRPRKVEEAGDDNQGQDSGSGG